MFQSRDFKTIAAFGLAGIFLIAAPLAAQAGETSTPATSQACHVAGEEKPASVCVSRNRTLAATCFNCHGPDGSGTTAIPVLAGMDKAHIVSALKAFKSGERPSTVMQRYAKGYTDAEYEAIAAYFANVKLKLAKVEGVQK